jgi:hypothetical protein
MQQAGDVTGDQESPSLEGKQRAAATWSLTLALLRHLVDDGMVQHRDAVGIIAEALHTIRSVLPEYQAAAALLEHEQALWERERAAQH